jgi:hypothetical protein
MRDAFFNLSRRQCRSAKSLEILKLIDQSRQIKLISSRASVRYCDGGAMYVSCSAETNELCV